MNSKVSGIESIAARAIDRWRVVMVVVCGLCFTGAVAWSELPRLEDPRVQPPEVHAFVPYPGATPEQVEIEVTRVLEDAIRTLPSVKTIKSTSLPSLAHIELRFEDGAQMETLVEAVRGKVLGASDLPEGVETPIVQRVDTATLTTQMVLMVAGNRANRVLTAAATELKSQLSSVSGVASVTLRGAEKRAMRVRVDPLRLQQHQLVESDVIAAVKRANARIPGGRIKMGAFQPMISLASDTQGVEGVPRIPVTTHRQQDTQRAVLLGDVAEVVEDYKQGGEQVMHRGRPAVALELRFRPDLNAVDVARDVRKLLQAGAITLPPGVALEVAYDQPAYIDSALWGFLRSLLEGALLVMLVVSLGLGLRAALVVATVLPVSLAGAVLGLYVFGFSLDQVSIAGLIVAVGLLVDDAIVVTESIQEMRERGLSGRASAIQGTARVFWANNGTTVVACASFLPLLLLDGDAGQYIAGLPAAVIFALVTSLLAAQFLTPWLASRFIRGHAPSRDTQDEATTHWKKPRGVLFLVKAAYLRSAEWVVRHPGLTVLGASSVLVLSFFALPMLGVQFFPKADKRVIFARVELAPGTDLTKTADKVMAVTRLVQKDPQVLETSAVIGGPFPQIFLGRASPRQGSEVGDMLVTLSTSDTGPVAKRLRAALRSIPGVRATVDELSTGPAIPHPISIRVRGKDPRQLNEYATHIKGALHGIPGVINVDDTLSSSILMARITLDGAQAALKGLDPLSTGLGVRSLYGEDTVVTIRRPDGEVEVIVEPVRAGSPSAGLEELLVASPTGMAQLRTAASIAPASSFAQLNRVNGQRVVDVTADVDGKVLPSRVIEQLRPLLTGMQWEPGYSFTIDGEDAATAENFNGLGLSAACAVLVIFFVLVLMFESFQLPVVVLAAVPYTLPGAVLGLFLTSTPFGFMSLLGLVSLIGICVNHKIYFVDRMLELRAQGLDDDQALIRAGLERVRPVVLTSVTAVLGLLPLTLTGGAFWAPFGWVCIFGLLSSVPLSLLFLPALLKLHARVMQRLARPAPRAAEGDHGQPGESEPPPHARPATPADPSVLLTASPPVRGAHLTVPAARATSYSSSRLPQATGAIASFRPPLYHRHDDGDAEAPTLVLPPKHAAKHVLRGAARPHPSSPPLPPWHRPGDES